jgi:hypothetical protein
MYSFVFLLVFILSYSIIIIIICVNRIGKNMIIAIHQKFIL